VPNRADELRWDIGAQAPGAPGGLTRAAIVATALAVADAEGIAAVSIRRVAAELSARPMSLYTHIASKDDLVDLMVNEVIAEVLVPEPLPADWRAALTAIAHASFVAFQRHAWALDAFGSRSRLSPSALRHADQSARAVASLDLDAPTRLTVLAILDDYAIGHAVRAAALERMGGKVPIEIDPVRFPEMAALAPGGELRPLENSFELGLQIILDGIERRLLR
jgi:AcrR family transcriptional regulator